MGPALYEFQGAEGLEDVRDAMTRHLKKPNSVGPVALFYGRPTCKVMKEVILPDLRYFHFRSAGYIECFCVGYVPFNGEFYTPTADANNDMFLASAFASAVRELEHNSSWEYKGQTDLVILNAYRAPASNCATLDFTTIISFCLEEAEKSGAIQSAGEFLERMLRFATEYKGFRFSYDFSDHLGLRQAASGLKEMWFRLLPNPISDAVKRSLSFYVKDYSNVEIAALALKCVAMSDEEILNDLPEAVGIKVIKAKQRILADQD